MFCEVCGQLIEYRDKIHRDGFGRSMGMKPTLVHSTADMYPQLNDHEPQLSPYDKARRN